MAPFGLKLWENAFQAIPDISFFDVEKTFSKLRTAVYPSNKARNPAKLCQNAFRTIPDISFFDVEIFSKLRTAVYPPRMAPIGAKLCQNAFRTIPNVSCFDAPPKIIGGFFFKNFGRNFPASKNETLGIVRNAF